uniref:Keratin n=1 Tax=Falco tinnunculus TaxID=100819 RepID=A0A8C4V0F9_FALTI
MSCAKTLCTEPCSVPCDAKCPEPRAAACNEPCVIACPDSRVIIFPPPVVVTLPGPILTTYPQETIVGSTESLGGSFGYGGSWDAQSSFGSGASLGGRYSYPCYSRSCGIYRPAKPCKDSLDGKTQKKQKQTENL